jgi:hypothetical protein
MKSDRSESSPESITERLLADTRSGLFSDATGRRFFRQRLVQFETIEIHEDEMHAPGWMGFEELPYPDWERAPESSRIREFAEAASERYLAFWYRVFDVAVARSLSGPRREIFQKSFFIPSVLFDIGVPENPAHASVPQGIHEKIIAEYRRSLGFHAGYRIFYISEYLKDLTADINERLLPLRPLWESRERRRGLLLDLNDAREEMLRPLMIRVRGKMLRDIIGETVMRTLLALIDRIYASGVIRSIGSADVRKLIFRRSRGDLERLQRGEIDLLISKKREIGLPDSIAHLYRSISLPDELYEGARFAASLLSSAYHLKHRLARMSYMHIRYGIEPRGDVLMDAIANRERLALDRIDSLDPRGEISEILMVYGSVVRLSEVIDGLTADDQQSAISRFFQNLSVKASRERKTISEQTFTVANRFYESCGRIASVDDAILSHYNGYLKLLARAGVAENSEPTDIPEDRRYASYERLEFPEGADPRNPFTERECVDAARRLILKRLRPLRMTASAYSLIPGQRHGALTLNPVMRLWKDRPYPRRREDPEPIGLEINTKETIESLIRLALLVDPGLSERVVQRGRIVAIGRRREDLSALTFFLLPGSCAPVRELDRRNFPEFRGRVIGEARAPIELGVDPSEDAVLTGGWYQKKNHTIYYPVGGDNGMLLRQIWNSGRAGGPPAFFFAIGQFVHDCIPDSLIYHFTGERTFRHCVEDYYRTEDKFRKNRGDRTGRRRMDNSRPAVRFMFAVNYSRLMLEALSGSSQGDFRHPMTEEWMNRHLGIPVLSRSDRSIFKGIRTEARRTIKEF